MSTDRAATPPCRFQTDGPPRGRQVLRAGPARISTLRRTLRSLPGLPRSAGAGPVAWLSTHGHRVFWAGRWVQVLGTGAWISATAFF